MQTVVAFGTFDILHPGHIAYIHYALTLGTHLIVVVTPDAVVHRRKKKPPLFTQAERIKMVSAIRGVDKVVLGDRDESWKVIDRLHPDILCFGYDQKEAIAAFRKTKMEKLAYPIVIKRAPAVRAKRYHSTLLKSFV